MANKRLTISEWMDLSLRNTNRNSTNVKKLQKVN